MNKYKVIKARKSEFENPIKLKKNELVEIIEKSDSEGDWAGWVLCRTDDNEGWLPRQIVSDDGYVNKDYDATEFDLELGEFLIEENKLNGWIYCYKETDVKRRAWAPLNHVELVCES